MANDRTSIWVPRDSAAVSVGADEVAAQIAENSAFEVRRTGTRGALWLEPLVEIEKGGIRYGFGPVSADAVPALLQAIAAGDEHELSLGPIEEVDWFRGQDRLTFARCGLIEPADLDGYEATGGLVGLQKALDHSAQATVDEVKASGLRGRGGAGFPAGIKWQTVLDQHADQKYICANADEGDSGTFVDRVLMEGDPFSLLEGMAIAGLATGATKGLVYIRSEYPDAIRTVKAAVEVMQAAGWLGLDIMGSGKAFDIEVRRGAGSYICGEESAMLDSLEGKRGMVRAKPPIPAIQGLHGKPTIVNNVLTLAAVPAILANGGKWYAGFGEGRSTGSQAFQLAGNIRRGGLIEKAFGVSLAELVEDYGGGTRSGRPLRAMQVGGPLGSYLGADRLETQMTYEAMADQGDMLGHGGIVVFDDSVDMASQARFAMEFCVAESCGKCTPCRIGSVRGVETIDRLKAGVSGQEEILRDLCEVMADGSLCAMGGLTPMPVLSALDRFPEDFGTQEKADA